MTDKIYEINQDYISVIINIYIMSQTIKCPNCSEVIDLDKIGEEKYKHMLEEQELSLKKQQ